jgi:hypothetical protein
MSERKIQQVAVRFHFAPMQSGSATGEVMSWSVEGAEGTRTDVTRAKRQ